MDINGKWKGTLIYGEGYSETIIGKELTFEFNITEHDDDIVGHGKDIAGSGINPSASYIKGFIDGDMISFIKKYESAGYFDLNGELYIIENVPSSEITYIGYFNPETNSYEGEWSILLDHRFNGAGMLIYECKGTWTMCKFD